MFDKLIYNLVILTIGSKQTSHMFLLCDLHFVLCLLDLNILREQRIYNHNSMRLEELITWPSIYCICEVYMIKII